MRQIRNPLSSPKLLSQNLQETRLHVEELVRDLHALAVEIGKPGMASTLDDLRERIREPFLFVIVGEVKAGKSSFINALLGAGREVTKVAPQPMTDTVQQILYGDEERTVEVNPYLKKIFLPVEILSEISIVDTPGTNTIVAHHQEITERFVPGSDLVVFVFEAKNPYRQSAWEFFDYIHGEWRRKVIFVLQQKDLMPAADLRVNIEGVRDQAIAKGVNDPTVFAVSALEEQAGKTEESGFAELFAYVRKNITGGRAAGLKVANSLDSAGHMLDRVANGLEEREQAFEADTAFRVEVGETLARHEQQANRQIEILSENLLGAYDRSTGERERELASGLSFGRLIKRAIAGLFSSEAGTKDWLDDFAKSMQNELTQELSTRLKSGVDDLAESLQNMTQTVHLMVQQKALQLPSDGVFFSEVADKRAAILLELQEAFERFISQSESFEGRQIFADRKGLGTNLLTGGGMAVIGAVLAAVTQLAVFDITGGIITTLGLLFAGVTTTVKRRKILQEYRVEVAKGRARLKEEVEAKLREYAEMIRKRIESHFTQLDAHLAQEGEVVHALSERIDQLRGRVGSLRRDALASASSGTQAAG